MLYIIRNRNRNQHITLYLIHLNHEAIHSQKKCMKQSMCYWFNVLNHDAPKKALIKMSSDKLMACDSEEYTA